MLFKQTVNDANNFADEISKHWVGAGCDVQSQLARNYLKVLAETVLKLEEKLQRLENQSAE